MRYLIGFLRYLSCEWIVKPNMNCLLFLIYALLILETVESKLLFGFKAQSNVFLSSSSKLSPHGFNIVDSYEWIRPIGNNAVAGLLGDSSDCEVVFSSLKSFDQDYRLKSNSDKSMAIEDMANVCRSIIANGLNKGEHFNVNGLIAGWSDRRQVPVLYWLDSIGSLKEVMYAAHGNEFPLVLSLFDDRYNQKLKLPDQQSEDKHDDNGIEIAKMTWDVVKRRKVESVGACRLVSVGKSGFADHGLLR